MNRVSRWPLALACLALGVAGGFYANSRLIGQVAPPPIPADLTSFRSVVKSVLPAVVSIETKAKARRVELNRPRGPVDPLPPGVPEEFRRFFEGFQVPDQPNVPSAGFGSGFLVDPNGVILTNYHVVAGADSVEVTLNDGRKFTSKDIRGDKKSDLAIVRIEANNLPFLELGDSDKMEVGDRVLAIGAPFGLTGSVTHGIVSAKSRNLRMNVYEDFIQTDAAINPGNSGGPLVSLDGKVIGINSAIKSRSGGFQGVGLAISTNLARHVKDQLQKDGTVRRGYLGVQIKDLTPEIAQALGLPDANGVVISRVMANTPAEKAGVEPGDVVTSIAGRPIHDGKELQKIVASLPLNQPVDVAVMREGKQEVLKVTIEEQPEEFASEQVPAPIAPRREDAATPLEQFGLNVTDFTPEMADRLGFRQAFRGAMVLRVEPGSAAEEAGLVKNMVIVRVDGKPVDSAASLKQHLAAATPEKGALLQVRSATGGTDFLLLKVAN